MSRNFFQKPPNFFFPDLTEKMAAFQLQPHMYLHVSSQQVFQLLERVRGKVEAKYLPYLMPQNKDCCAAYSAMQKDTAGRVVSFA